MADTTSSASNCSNSGSIVCFNRLQIAETDRDDKISNLPDEILCHILSYLPTKEAVRTTLLSKRWSYVWIFLPIPKIEIDDLSYLEMNISPDVKNRFMDYVDRELHLKGLKQFSLRCSQNYDHLRVSEWMRAVFMHGVEEFDLTFLVKQQFDFDPELSGKQHVEFPISSEELVILKLRDMGHHKNLIFSIPPSVYLPSLKILHLQLVHFCNDDSMKNLIDGCPVLEEFYIMIDDDDDDDDDDDANDDENFNDNKWVKLFDGSSSLMSLIVDNKSPVVTVKSLRIYNEAQFVTMLFEFQ